MCPAEVGVTVVGEEPTGGPAGARDSRVYDESYYRGYEGGSYDRGGHWTRFFGYIADEVVARWAPRTTLDAGCALGIFVEELRRRDVDAWGVDVSEYAIGQVPAETRPFCFVGSLAAELPAGLPRRFDLVSCIEVLEHMDRAEGDKAIGQLCSVTDRILFSSTPDGFGEPTHFTCRTPEDWSAVFARHGFLRAFDADASFVAPWAVVYERRDLTPYELVLEYDRRHARLAEEVRQLRTEVIALDKKAARTGDAALHDEVARLRLELMAARDQAVGSAAEKDAALARRSDESRQAAERAAARSRSEVEHQIHNTGVWKLSNQLHRAARGARKVRRRLGGDR